MSLHLGGDENVLKLMVVMVAKFSEYAKKKNPELSILSERYMNSISKELLFLKS